jgi:hypothetical protein
MSHVAVVKVNIRSLEALDRACRALGLELRLGQKTFRWYGSWQRDYRQADAAPNAIDPALYGRCEHAVAVPNDTEAYEVGVVNNPAGEGFVMAFDSFDPCRRMVDKVGQDCGLLAQEYAAQVAEMEAQELISQGWQIQRVVQPNGDLQVVLTQ